MIQQIERWLNNDTNLLIEKKGDAPLNHILFPDAPCPKQTQQKQNPACSWTLSARFSPMNRPPTPIMKPTIAVKHVPTVVFKPKRKTILDLSNDPDHPVEWAPLPSPDSLKRSQRCMTVQFATKPVKSKFVMSAENVRDSGQSSTNTSNTQQHSQQLSSRVAEIIHFNL